MKKTILALTIITASLLAKDCYIVQEPINGFVNHELMEAEGKELDKGIRSGMIKEFKISTKLCSVQVDFINYRTQCSAPDGNLYWIDTQNSNLIKIK